ncbi:glycerophosphodiester phosphodiesterase [Streptomyces sp. NPDC017448]|uniref:glycerophosphodiester phosphodiesterase n=1 Tax=Streptomyces sp. NPDC017448 TaxID=3364996 RepID=UPI003799FBB5
MAELDLPDDLELNWDVKLNAAIRHLNEAKAEKSDVVLALDEALAEHSAAVDPHGDRAFVTAALGDLVIPTPSGISAEIASAVTSHTAAADPHGDRAHASQALSAAVSALTASKADKADVTADIASAVTTHSAAVDPHGDRAHAASALASAVAQLSTTKADKTAVSTDVAAAVSDHRVAVDPHGDRAHAQSAFLPQAVITVSSLMSTTPFYICHRGSGGEFPEHTMAAYEASVAAGALAIEVSVRVTADGVLVCLHDEALDRTTYSSGDVSTWTYAALKNRVLTNGKLMLGEGWTDQPIPTLREVLDRFLGKVVIFLEAKSSAAVPILQQLLLNQYPQAQKSVVWKQFFQHNSLPWARANGFQVWGYVNANSTDAELNAVDANIDFWGVPYTMTDARIRNVVDRGKKVICWEVHRRGERDRLLSLGVHGMMCAQYLYVRRSTALGTRDDFASRIKSPGNLPSANYDGTKSLKYDETGGWVRIDAVPNEAVVLGRLGPSPVGPGGTRIFFDMKFDTLPGANQHAGIAFGKVSDEKYGFNQANASGGYHLVFRVEGLLQLYTHAAGNTSGVKLAEVQTAAPVAGGAMSFQVDLTATQVILRRTDVVPTVELVVTDSQHRGRYMHLSGGSVTTKAAVAHFRNVEVVDLP